VIYWRNPKNNYTFEAFGSISSRMKGLKSGFLVLNEDNPFNLPGGMYTINDESKLEFL